MVCREFKGTNEITLNLRRVQQFSMMDSSNHFTQKLEIVPYRIAVTVSFES